jgi:hypothetical protein
MACAVWWFGWIAGSRLPFLITGLQHVPLDLNRR